MAGFIWLVEHFNSIRPQWRQSRFQTTVFHASRPLGSVTCAKIFVKLSWGDLKCMHPQVLHCYTCKASLACKHLELSCIVFCCGAGCHFEVMKLCTSRACSFRVSKGSLDILQEDVQCLHLGLSVYDCHGLVCCPNLCCASTHEGKCIQDLHSFICEGVHLHSNHNLDGPHEFLSFVMVSLEWLGVSSFSTLDWVM